MQKCECYEIEDKINKEFPNANWNCDQACDAWHERSDNIRHNDNVEQHEPEDYACNCPNCGRCICGWCV